MKKVFAIMVLVPALLAAKEEGLTLDAVRLAALKDNPSVKEAQHRVEAAEAVYRQVRSAYLPTVSTSLTVGAVDSSMHPEHLPHQRFADSFKQADASLQGRWLLFNGFAREARTLASKYDLERTQQVAEDTRLLLVRSATVAFRQAQLAAENIKVGERDREYNLKLEADARKRFDAGLVAESSVSNFSIRALSAQNSVDRAELEYKVACAALAELMALPDSTLPVRPVAIVDDVADASLELAEHMSYALEHRPDYLALRTAYLAQGERIRAAKGDRIPTIALVSEINYAENEGLIDVDRHGNYDSFVGATVNWDIFSGRRKRNAIEQARAESFVVEQQLAAARLAIRSTLQQQLDQIKTTKTMLDRQRQIYDLSVSLRESMEKEYEVGAVSITRLNESQTDVSRSDGARASALIDHLLAIDLLEIETGRVLESLSVR